MLMVNAFGNSLKKINFLSEENLVDSYQAQAISFGLYEKISDTLQIYVQESHIPFMFEKDDSKIKFLPDTPLSALLSFKAISVDLNDDSINEVIAYASGNLVCGSSGCPSYILAGKEKEWKLIGEYFPGEQFSISPNKTNDYFDIIILSTKKSVCKFSSKNYLCE